MTRGKHAELRQELQSDYRVETRRQPDVLCPWCGEVQTIEDVGRQVLYKEGEYPKQHCRYCGKKFRVTTYVTYTYYTRREGK